MKVTQSPSFYRFIKKIDKKFKAEIDKQIHAIIATPSIGEEKKGDLQGVLIHKFKHLKTLYLIAYRNTTNELQLVMIGTHENFYRDLKGYIKS